MHRHVAATWGRGCGTEPKIGCKWKYDSGQEVTSAYLKLLILSLLLLLLTNVKKLSIKTNPKCYFAPTPPPPQKKKTTKKKLIWCESSPLWWSPPILEPTLSKDSKNLQDSIRWNVKRKNKEYSPFVYGFATFLLVITLAVALLTCQQTDRD